MESLNIPEQLVLLAVDKSGRFSRKVWSLGFYVSAACIIELIMRETLGVTDKHHLTVTGDQPNTGLSYLDLTMERIAKSSKPRPMRRWLVSLYSWRGNRIRKAVLAAMLERGLLASERKRLLLIFTVTRYRAQSEVKETLIEKLRAELLEEGPLDDETKVLTLLLSHAKLLKEYFSPYEKDIISQRVDQIVEETAGSAIGVWWEQMKKAYNDIQATAASSSVGAIGGG